MSAAHSQPPQSRPAAAEDHEHERSRVATIRSYRKKITATDVDTKRQHTPRWSRDNSITAASSVTSKELQHSIPVASPKERSISDVLEKAERVISKINQLLRNDTATMSITNYDAASTTERDLLDDATPSSERVGNNSLLLGHFLFADDSQELTPIPIHRNRNPVISPTPYDLASSSSESIQSSPLLPSNEEITQTCQKLDEDIGRVFDAITLEQSVANLKQTAESTMEMLRRTKDSAYAIQQENKRLRRRSSFKKGYSNNTPDQSNSTPGHSKEPDVFQQQRRSNDLTQQQYDSTTSNTPINNYSPNPSTSPGVEFVAGLCQVMELDPGQHLYLANIMDRSTA